MELVERMLLDGIRVIYLDLTNQYEEELAPYVDVEEQEEVLADLEELGAEGKDNLQKHVEEGGSIQQFSAQVIKVVASFLDPTAENQLDRPEPV